MKPIYEIKAAGLIGTYAALGFSRAIYGTGAGNVKFRPPSIVEVINPSTDFEERVFSGLQESLRSESRKLDDIPTMAVKERKRLTLGDFARECTEAKLILNDLETPLLRKRSVDRKRDFLVYLPLSPEYGKYKKVYDVGLNGGVQAYVPVIVGSLALFGLISCSVHVRAGDDIFFVAIIPTVLSDGPELGKIQGLISDFIGEGIPNLLKDPNTPSYVVPLLAASTLRGLRALSAGEESDVRHLRNCSLIVYSMNARRQEPRTYTTYPFNKYIDFVTNLNPEDRNLYELMKTCIYNKLWDVPISLAFGIEDKDVKKFFEAIYAYRSHITAFEEKKRERSLFCIRDGTIKNAIRYFS